MECISITSDMAFYILYKYQYLGIKSRIAITAHSKIGLIDLKKMNA